MVRPAFLLSRFCATIFEGGRSLMMLMCLLVAQWFVRIVFLKLFLCSTIAQFVFRFCLQNSLEDIRNVSTGPRVKMVLTLATNPRFFRHVVADQQLVLNAAEEIITQFHGTVENFPQYEPVHLMETLIDMGGLCGSFCLLSPNVMLSRLVDPVLDSAMPYSSKNRLLRAILSSAKNRNTERVCRLEQYLLKASIPLEGRGISEDAKDIIVLALTATCPDEGYFRYLTFDQVVDILDTVMARNDPFSVTIIHNFIVSPSIASLNATMATSKGSKLTAVLSKCVLWFLGAALNKSYGADLLWTETCSTSFKPHCFAEICADACSVFWNHLQDHDPDSEYINHWMKLTERSSQLFTSSCEFEIHGRYSLVVKGLGDQHLWELSEKGKLDILDAVTCLLSSATPTDSQRLFSRPSRLLETVISAVCSLECGEVWPDECTIVLRLPALRADILRSELVAQLHSFLTTDTNCVFSAILGLLGSLHQHFNNRRVATLTCLAVVTLLHIAAAETTTLHIDGIIASLSEMFNQPSSNGVGIDVALSLGLCWEAVLLLVPSRNLETYCQRALDDVFAHSREIGQLTACHIVLLGSIVRAWPSSAPIPPQVRNSISCECMIPCTHKAQVCIYLFSFNDRWCVL
jgi:hypothetical protein